MEVNVSLATTGELVYSTDFSEVQDRQVWELRLQICRELVDAPYFSCVLFHELTSWMIQPRLQRTLGQSLRECYICN